MVFGKGNCPVCNESTVCYNVSGDGTIIYVHMDDKECVQVETINEIKSINV